MWTPHYVTVTQVCGFECVWHSLNLVFVQSRAPSHVGATRVLWSHYFYFTDSASLAAKEGTTPVYTGKLMGDAQPNGLASSPSSVLNWDNEKPLRALDMPTTTGVCLHKAFIIWTRTVDWMHSIGWQNKPGSLVITYRNQLMSNNRSDTPP